ncbi:MAG: peptide/nickel transport system permease protein [Gaiellales bacterium]|jgi:peptide/nickel transport system permease protein|nr:peptide/nickel transport system permease protein [Gaiellales bacterium]
MIRFLAKRLALGLVTLGLLSILIFLGTTVLPGNPGRAIAGPFASEATVKAINHQLGTDRPVVTQYADWIKGVVTGDLGTSYAQKLPVSTLVKNALINSLKLALLAFVLVVPLGILGGVVSALNEGRWVDRVISVGGLSAAVMPEFVGGIVLLVVFSLWLNILPISASWPPGTGPLEQIKYLLLPAMALTLVLFGYIARIARAGTVESLRSDYIRTAYLKGLPRRTVIFRHVLRNSLLPTIAVVATQTGYLIGGLVVVERLFNYNGIGQLLFQAAHQKDYPLLESAVLVIGVVYLVSTLVADILSALLNPRIRVGSDAS